MSLYHSREHFIRSTMEGVIFGLKESLEIFKGMGIRFDKVIASGGGARGQLFREIQQMCLRRRSIQPEKRNRPAWALP